MTRGNLAAASCAQENQLRRAGNLTSYTDGTTTFNAAVNDLNQLSIVNGTPWQYDANGNLINDGRYQYVWDDANRLIGIMDSSTGTVTSFSYDGLGRRLAIGQSDANGNLAETRYLWCGDELCGAPPRPRASPEDWSCPVHSLCPCGCANNGGLGLAWRGSGDVGSAASGR